MHFREPLRFTPHRNAAGEAFFADACAKGWEGILGKRADAPYISRRSTDWLKFKCSAGQEVVIGGFTEPTGSRIGLGALLVGYFEGDDLVYAGKVGEQLRPRETAVDRAVSGRDRRGDGA